MLVQLLLSLIVVPLGAALIAWIIPAQFGRLYGALDRYERIYWRLNLAGCIPVAYGAVVSALVMLDDMRGEPWRLMEWWPSVFAVWYTTDNRSLLIVLDLLTAVAVGLGLISLSRCLGYVDQHNIWRRSALLIHWREKQHGR